MFKSRKVPHESQAAELHLSKRRPATGPGLKLHESSAPSASRRSVLLSGHSEYTQKPNLGHRNQPKTNSDGVRLTGVCLR